MNDISNLPSAVAKQGDAADKLQKDYAKGTLVDIVDPEKPSEPEDKPTPEPPEKKVEKKPEDKKPEPDSFEHKYNVLKGKYDNEISSLKQSLSEANKTIENLNALIVQVQSKPKAKDEVVDVDSSGRPEIPSDAATMGLDPEDFRGYGDEMVDMVNLVNKQAMMIRNLSDSVKSTTEKVEKSADDKFFEGLTKLVPDWKKVNEDSRWKNWLAQMDRLSGMERQVLLDDANKANDFNRVALFFNDFKQEVDWKTETASPPDESTEEETPSLEEQESIESGPEKPIDNSKKPALTRAQYNKAVNDRVQGRISDEEFEKISNEFQRAIDAGLVT